MIDMSLKEADNSIDELSIWFSKRYKLKKRVNALFCFFIAFWGTIFTSAVSLISGIVCVIEAARETEVTKKSVYFLRLSSATTESVIFTVVMVGLIPLVPDEPDIYSYPGIMMHLVVPIVTVMSFLLNDPPYGKPKPVEPMRGTLFLAIYGVVMIFFFRNRNSSQRESTLFIP